MQRTTSIQGSQWEEAQINSHKIKKKKNERKKKS